MTDLIEDVLAFLFATQEDRPRVCAGCGRNLADNEGQEIDGELLCDDCKDGGE